MSLKWQDLIFNSENFKNKKIFSAYQPTNSSVYVDMYQKLLLFVTEITKKYFDYPWGKVYFLDSNSQESPRLSSFCL